MPKAPSKPKPLPMPRVFFSLRRHSNRQPIMLGTDAIQARLTDKGKRNAKRQGKSLARRNQLLKVYTSHFDRANETGKLIAQGAESPYNVQIRNEFAVFSKGSRQKAKAGGYFRDESVKQGFDKWLSGEIPKDLVFSPHEVAVEAMKSIRLAKKADERMKRFAKPGSKNIRIEAISHDVTQVALFFELTGRKPKWPYTKFLGEMEFSFNDGKVWLKYQKNKFNVTEKFNQLAEEAREKEEMERAERIRERLSKKKH